MSEPAARASAIARARVLGMHQLAERMVRAVVGALGPDARVVPLKGTLLARTHYDNVVERPMGDCDLAVAELPRGETLRRLQAAGFRVLRVEADPHTTVLLSDVAPNIQLDLHTRPLPVGYGAVTCDWLAEGARRDTELFGAPVWVPTDARLLVHLLGNVLRDHITRAHGHTAEDVARVVERSAQSAGDFAGVITQSRLRRGCWAALDWVHSVRASGAVERVRDAVPMRPWERRYAAWRLDRMRAWGRANELDWRARLVARAVSDDPRDVAAGLAVGVLGLANKRLHRG